MTAEITNEKMGKSVQTADNEILEMGREAEMAFM
jgi:hypothetical protein